MSPLAPLLLKGDALTELMRIPDDSIDSIVTDPPYGLANTDPAQVVEALTKWAQGERDFIPAGKGFMGKAWDAFVPPPAVWDECLRVLKPGGHLLAFAGSRTFDLMTLSIRFAGFDIRDSIAWLYGSGFPKSMDVSKAIDKARDDHDDLLAVTARLADLAEVAGVTRRHLDEAMGTSDMGGWWLSRVRGRAAVASVENWKRLRELIPGADELDDEVWRLNGRKGEWGNVRPDRVVSAAGANAVFQPTQRVERAGSPASEISAAWQGWGTALKPAFEPIVVARKPFPGTVAANVLAHGTGALNIDATRVGDGSESQGERPATEASATSRYTERGSVNLAATPGPRGGSPSGRWPANVMLDESQAAELDRQAPNTGGSGKASGPTLTGASTSVARGAFAGVESTPFYGGELSGASRFFYVAKAPKSERPVVGGVAHPTVKPLTLMRQLVKLVTPPDGVVLEPFAGSGTTLEAAYLEGFESIGIEMTPDYWPLIQARIERIMQ